MKRKEDTAEDDYGWFETDSMEAVDAMEAMTSFLKAQHQSALELTKLTLEHCKIENLTKEKVFNIFQDAINLMGKNVKNPMQ
jgi:hypothetical protein